MGNPWTTPFRSKQESKSKNSVDLQEVVSPESAYNFYACPSCASSVVHKEGEMLLHCEFCGFEKELTTTQLQAMKEKDYEAFLSCYQEHEEFHTAVTAQCSSCGSEVELPEGLHSGECAFCQSPVVVSTLGYRTLAPQALLPFALNERVALQFFDHWSRRRWLAPEIFRKKAHEAGRWSKIFLPFWTFDALTNTAYKGLRGQMRSRRYNGKTQMQMTWTPVSGQVQLSFDDLLIPATRRLEKTVFQKTAKWDLSQLVDYKAAFLSGAQSELFQVKPEAGYSQACEEMDRTITRAIRRNIGGSAQKIQYRSTQRERVTFKHILLPYWLGTYKYGNKIYSFVVNAQTGTVSGEYPYSKWKIGLLVLLAILGICGIITFIAHNPEMLQLFGSIVAY